VAETFHAFASGVPTHFERDMGYNEKEFFRVLPAAIGEYKYTQEGDLVSIRHSDNDHQIDLTVRPLPDRRLGAFRIQRIDVQFAFSNMSQAQRDTFMARFDRRFQRGGG